MKNLFPKNEKIRTGLKQLFFHLFMIPVLILAVSIAYGQRPGGGAPSIRYSGVSVQNGMLVFSSESTFQTVYTDLDNKILAHFKDSESPYQVDDEECEDNGVLAAFENNFRDYVSARKASLTNECALLEKGADPMDIKEPWIVTDPTIGAMVNEKFEVKVGNSVFWLPYENLGYEITDGRITTLRTLQKGGVNPYRMRNVKVVSPPDEVDREGACSAKFSVSGNNMNYSFTFMGSPTPISNPGVIVTFHWTFGDGTVSSTQHPAHTYETPGEYNVCLLVEMYDPEEETYCSDQICRTVSAKEAPNGNDCHWFDILKATFVWNETGKPGELCFTPTGNLFAQIIDQDVAVDYLWSFGDGTVSNERTPCHTFKCDKKYTISLTVTTAAGCENVVVVPININSNRCCDKNPKTLGEKSYASKRKIKYEQRHFHFWFFGGIHNVMVIAKNYRKGAFGWYKKRTNLKIETEGHIYGSQAAGCICEDPHDITDEKIGYTATLVLKKGYSSKFWARRSDQWLARYFVENEEVLEKEVEAFCD